MSMKTPPGSRPNPMIDTLAEQLEPVRPLKLRDGMVLVALTTLVTILAVEWIMGLWAGAIDGSASPFFMVTNGLLLVLGIAAAASAVTMAGPRVGNRHDGPKWAMAMAGVVPAAALLTLVQADQGAEVLTDPYGLGCMLASLAASLLTGTALVFWLRRGAPVSVNAAGFHVGVAAGALGSLAYGLSCPVDNVGHLGLWHIAPVIVAGIAGRFIIPPLLRW